MKGLKQSATGALVKGLLAVNRLRQHKVDKNSHNNLRQNRQTNTGKESEMAEVQALFETMASRFNAAAAGDMAAVFQYKLDEGDAYYAAIAEGNCTLGEGEHEDPTVTLSMDSQTFQEVLDGETDGMQAFMTGRIRAEGDIMLATKLAALFPVG